MSTKPNNGTNIFDPSIYKTPEAPALKHLRRYKSGEIMVDAKRHYRGGAMLCSVYAYKDGVAGHYSKNLSERVLLHRVELPRDTTKEVVEMTLESLCALVTIQYGVEVKRRSKS